MASRYGVSRFLYSDGKILKFCYFLFTPGENAIQCVHLQEVSGGKREHDEREGNGKQIGTRAVSGPDAQGDPQRTAQTGDRLPTESELAGQYGLRKTNVHLGRRSLERLGFLRVVPRHATYVAPYWEQANLETLAAIMTHGGKPQPELVDAFLELREMVALGWFRWTAATPKRSRCGTCTAARADGGHRLRTGRREGQAGISGPGQSVSGWCMLPSRTT